MVYAGKDGFFKIGTGSGAVAVAYIDNFSLTIDAALLDVSQLGNQWSKHITGLKTWSGTISGTLDLSDAKQKEILEMFTGNGTVSAKEMHLGLGGTQEISGSAVISNISISAAVADKITFSANFTGDDAPTLTTAAA